MLGVCGGRIASLIVPFSPRASSTALCLYPEKTLHDLLASLTSHFAVAVFVLFFFFNFFF